MIPLSQRGEIRLGFRCNARCGFCYYQTLLDVDPSEEPPTKVIFQQLERLRKAGGTEVEFTGGEPTIKQDLPRIIAYAKELGFINVSLITNGLRLANYGYALGLVNAGLNDVLFSVHGHNDEVHDLHTKIPGSFNQIIQAINNVKKLGIRVRVTSTITAENTPHVQEIMAFFIQLKVACIHFAVFSPVGPAEDTDSNLYVSYSDVAEALKKAITDFEDQLPQLSIKYIPFCFLVGYEKYVMNLYQQSYDPDDWNYYYSNKVRRTNSLLSGLAFDAAALFGALFSKTLKASLSHGVLGLKVAGFTRIVELIRKTHPSECKKCRYVLVCDGVWKNYTKTEGVDKIKAVAGEKIKHPAWAYEISRYRVPGNSLLVGPKDENIVRSRPLIFVEEER